MRARQHEWERSEEEAAALASKWAEAFPQLCERLYDQKALPFGRHYKWQIRHRNGGSASPYKWRKNRMHWRRFSDGMLIPSWLVSGTARTTPSGRDLDLAYILLRDGTVRGPEQDAPPPTENRPPSGWKGTHEYVYYKGTVEDDRIPDPAPSRLRVKGGRDLHKFIWGLGVEHGFVSD